MGAVRPKISAGRWRRLRCAAQGGQDGPRIAQGALAGRSPDIGL